MSTIITTNRTIEISKIDEDYMMPLRTNVQSVVFIPGNGLKVTDCVYIVENNIGGTNPIKCFLISSIDGTEQRTWIFNQRLQLGFIFAKGVFSTGSKVIFNIGELHYSNRRGTNIRISSMNTRMLTKLNAQDMQV